MQYHIHISNVFSSLLSYIHIKSETRTISQKNKFEDVILYMKKRLSANITLDDMANHFNLSKDHFTKLFKKQYGFTPIDYFIHMKLQKACEMITMTNKSLKEIAGEVGYSDYYYFSRIFKSKVGLSPRTYKAQFTESVD